MLFTFSASWILWFLAIVLSQGTCRQLSIHLPWTAVARKVNAPFFFSLAILPLLLGFVSIGVLKLAPEQSHLIHQALIFIFLTSAYVISRIVSWKYSRDYPALVSADSTPYAWDEKTLRILFIGFLLLLIVSALLYPLIQPDALEYAQMGRIVFDDRGLTNYPPIISSNHPAGFYLPVTHPPLYIAMVYVANLIQGNAETPFIMRLISPWLALVTAGLVYAAGALINRRTGWYSAVLFISTPLLFMGAAASLIDPLAVLGFCLVFVSIFFFESTPIKLGIIQGAFLGIALWTHSQAVLFPLLLIASLILNADLRNWRDMALQIGTLIPTSILLGFLPYWENYTKFGSIISDNPLVFQLKNLAWNDYFLIGRGVDSLSAQIQYGLLKGWFTPEAYGLTFWIITAGVVWWLKPPESSKRIVSSAMDMIVIYHLGIALAIILGIHQMFRIERYMLVILPCIAVLGGFVLSGGFVKPIKRVRNLLAWSFISIMAVQIIIFGVKQTSLSNQFEMQFLNGIRTSLPNNSVILSMQPGDMYYTGKKVISHLDPELKYFYETAAPEEGWRILKSLGVTHIHIVPSALPSFYNSTLQAIVADPQLTTLLATDKGNQIYYMHVNKTHLPIASKNNLLPKNVGWFSTHHWLIGGRKVLAKIPISTPYRITQLRSETKLPLLIFQRDLSTLLQTTPSIPVQEKLTYQINFELRGFGLVRFWITQYDRQGNPLTENPKASAHTFISEIILSNQFGERKTSYRFKTLAHAKFLQVGVEHYGSSWLEVTSATLVRQK